MTALSLVERVPLIDLLASKTKAHDHFVSGAVRILDGYIKDPAKSSARAEYDPQYVLLESQYYLAEIAVEMGEAAFNAAELGNLPSQRVARTSSINNL